MGMKKWGASCEAWNSGHTLLGVCAALVSTCSRTKGLLLEVSSIIHEKKQTQKQKTNLSFK